MVTAESVLLSATLSIQVRPAFCIVAIKTTGCLTSGGKTVAISFVASRRPPRKRLLKLLPPKKIPASMTQRCCSEPQDVNQSQKPLRLMGFKVDGKQFWIVTDRFDLSTEQVAIYCHEQNGEPVNINRVRELRCQIRNEALQAMGRRNNKHLTKKISGYGTEEGMQFSNRTTLAEVRSSDPAQRFY